MANKDIDFKKFPTTRYQGSKRKILPWLHAAFKELRFTTALDACGGSASVSYLLKKMGKEVAYNDKLHFNYLIGKAIIQNPRYILSENDILELKRPKPEINYDNLITRNFRDIYYLPRENTWLDTMANNILNMNHYHGNILEYKKAIAYYALFQSSMIKRPFNLFHRNNLDLRTADVERNFGNKTTWEGSFNSYFSRFVEEANGLIFNTGKQCYAFNESILEIDPYGYQMVYIDTPYLRKDGSNESSNYLKCYHFLEGLSMYDEWENLIDFESINHRLADIEIQNDFKEENIYETFEKIIEKFKRSKIVLSYKKGGIPSIQFIVNMMSKHKRNVRTVSMHYKYALNHQNGDAVNNREVLIIGT